ncbi:MAG: lytic murein transglycosylase B [Burkholderiaceae bacterium]
MLRSRIRRSLLLGAATWPMLAASPTRALAAKATSRTTRKTAAKPKTVAAVAYDAAPDMVTYGSRDDVMRFADAIAERRGLDAGAVRAALADARFVPSVARYIMPSAAGAAKNWAAYRARFVEPIRIRAGVAFWRENVRWLAMAEEIYGVPPEIVVGIVGVESIYGRQMGNFRVIDALATLAFDFPTGRKDRSEFFRDELENWFVLCNSEHIDPLAWRGSYAGAIGMAQFMPSSFNKYAVDLDGDGHIDLHRSSADVIGSVANYLAEFGWKRGLAVRFDVEPPVDSSERALLLGPDIVPTFSAADMAAHGAVLAPDAAAADSLFALVELQNGDAAPSFVAGTSNFYAITRYNWSSYYTMAVVSLGEAVRSGVRPASG